MTTKEDLEIDAFNKKNDYKLSFIIAILLSLCLTGFWYILITNTDMIWNHINVFIFPMYFVIAVMTIIGIVTVLLMMSDGYTSYVKYGEIKIKLKHLSDNDEMNK